jgi:hypothetical protein
MVMATYRRLIAALVAAAVLAGCAGEVVDGEAGITVPDVTATNGIEGTPRTSPSSNAETPPFTATPLSPRSDPASPQGHPIDPTLPLVQGAVEDLAQRLEINPEDVVVVEALAVTWPDGGLGCPQPGMAYTQVQVDGALVVLEAGGRRYEYHGGDPLFLCEQAK